MKKVYVLLSLCCMAIVANAQTAANYGFSRATGTLTPIEGGTGTVSSTTISSDDAGMTGIPIGFSFVYCGVAYTQLSANSNGWLSLANSSVSSGTTAYSNTAANMGSISSGVGLLMAFWDDLSGSSSTAYYQTSGTAPNRVFTFQWGNSSTRWGNVTGSGTALFQVKLYEGSNIVQFAYGAGTYTGNSATIGISNSSSDYRTLADQTSTTAGTTFSTSVTASPSENTVMTWTPPACSGTPAAGTLSSSVSSGCSPVAPTLTITGGTTGYSGLTYQWQSSPTGSVWTDITGASGASYQPSVTETTYYRRSTTCGVSSASTGNVTITVNPSPAPIVGGPYICLGQSVSLSTASTGGTWSSSATTVSISTSGVATGASVGTSNISYSFSNGCRAILPMTVNSVIPTVSASASVSTICAGGSTTLTATPTSTLTGYDMTAIPYSFTTQTSPTTVSSYTSIDDGYATVTLPFSFTFWGTAYTTAYIGTNGYIAFGTSATARAVVSLPTTTLPAAIVYCLGDLYVTSPGSIIYSTEGVAPNRVFVITFDRISLCCSYGDAFNAQIKLYETTNTIDLLVSASASGSHSMGIQNSAGTQALAPAGRNNASYVITPSAPEAYRFAIPQATYSWSPSTFIPSNTSLTVVASSVTTTPTTVFTVTRSYNGCSTSATVPVTVNALPPVIDGNAAVCIGLATSLSNTTSGGTWASSTPTIGTINTSGVLAGLSVGTTTVFYTVPSTGCSRTQIVTVNPLPGAITGTAVVCAGATTTLSDSTTGGTWSSSSPSVASVVPGGTVSGVQAGLVDITYTSPVSCIATRQVTVNPLPTINVTPSSAMTACQGQGTPVTVTSPPLKFALLSQNFNSGLGLWTITSPSSPADGLSAWHVTSASAIGVAGDGSAMLEAAPGATGAAGGLTETILTSPGFSTAGITAAELTFNENLFSVPTSDEIVDVQYSTNGGAAWTSLYDQLGTSVEAETWSASSSQVTVALPSAALNAPDVKLRWYYKSNYGGWWQIDNIAVKLTLPAPTFTWAGVGGAVGLSCPGCTTPANTTMTVTPTTAGSNVYSVTANGACSAGSTFSINVNPLPATITGTSTTLCVGRTITLGNADAGGSWTSDNSSVASIDAATGAITGVGTGSAVISYALPTTCYRTVTVYVTPAPAPITGTLHVCDGLTTALGHPVTGGLWSSSDAVASINASTGLVTGNGSGNAVITYVLPSGCRTTANMTVNELPASITGTQVVCVNQVTTLASTSTSGEWISGNIAVATVGATSGIVSGVSGGTATITYKLASGCQATAVVTVNTLPGDIGGVFAVCEEATTTLTNGDGGGAWSSSNAALGSVDVNGVVSGLVAGTVNISYALSTGCFKIAHVTVNALPGAITGIREVCEGSTTVLASTPVGGTWSGSTAVAAINWGTGVVSGLHDGVSSVTYTLTNGCSRTAAVTVNALPDDILGVFAVCVESTTTLTNDYMGGTWSSSNAILGSVDVNGVVSGLASGNVDVSYTLSTGCFKTAHLTINALPGTISGTKAVCEGATTTLASSPTGGTWSGNTTEATIGASTGIVSGIQYGVSNVTYTLSNGCSRIAVVTVNALPGDISGTFAVCKGATTTLGSTSGGQWTSSNTAIADVNTSGVVTGLSDGTTRITYAITSTGCMRSVEATVDPVPADISGTLQVCEGAATTLVNSTPGGVWSTSLFTVATVSSTGIVNGVSSGTEVVTYALPTGCKKTANVVVNPLPADISGSLEVCAGLTTSLSTLTTGGAWSGGSFAVATIDGSGVVSAVNAGTTTVTYTLGVTGCRKTAEILVDPLPGNITGPLQVCEGLTITLASSTTGGVWSTDAPGIADVDVAGVVSGAAFGNVNIAYTLPGTGCSRSVNVSVNALPDVITGTFEACEGATATLANTTTSGSWIASSTIAGVGVASGIVTGVTAGTVDISYVLPTGCMRSVPFTVKSLPADIVGTLSVCSGLTTTLTNPTMGGAWSGGDAAIATIDVSGVVNGVAAGTVDVVYTALNGCFKTANVAVKALPADITGVGTLCESSTTSLANTTPGGVWTSSAPATASVDLLSGVVTGASVGSASITYALATGCIKTADIIVNSLPAPITGVLAVCQGLTTTLSGGIAGTWSTVSTNAVIDAAGVVTGLIAGTAEVTYTLGTGCSRTANVVVKALPVVYNVTGGGSYCAGTGGVTIGTDGSQGGVNYQLYNGSVAAVGAMAGSGMAVAFGSYSTAGTYTVLAVNVATGCVSSMAGDATVTILPLNIPSVTLASGVGATVCAGTAVTYSATPVNGGTSPAYAWEVNGAPMPSTSSSFAYTPLHGDIVKVTLTSNASCAIPATATDAMTMTVEASQTPVAVATPSGALSVCQGSNLTLTAISLYGGTAPVYEWYVNSALVGTGVAFTYVPNNGDLVATKLTSNYSCLTTSAVMSNTLTVTTSPVYVPVVSIAVSPGTSIAAGATVTFSAVIDSNAGPSPTFQWYYNGAPITGATSVTYVTSSLSNNDSVSCKVTGTAPCGHESFNSVLMRVQTGVGQYAGSSDDVVLMPNPNKGNFMIKGHIAEHAGNDVGFEITNMLGQIVYRAKTIAVGGRLNEMIQLDNNLANGMYMLNVRTGDETRVFHFVLEQ